MSTSITIQKRVRMDTDENEGYDNDDDNDLHITESTSEQNYASNDDKTKRQRYDNNDGTHNNYNSGNSNSLSHKFAPKRETDHKKIEARLKQIKFGKNTIGYDNYRALVKISSRNKNHYEHPRTPDPYEIQSKRAFDGRIKLWRRELHKWDNINVNEKSAAELLCPDTNKLLENIIGDNTCNIPGITITTKNENGLVIEKEFEDYMMKRTQVTVEPMAVNIHEPQLDLDIDDKEDDDFL